MKRALFLAAALALPVTAALAFGVKMYAVEQRQEKSDVELVKVMSDSAVTIYVNKNSIEEHDTQGVTFRTAQVLYDLNKPITFKGKKAYYMYTEVGYHCGSNIFITARVILLDENVEKLFMSDEVGEATKVEKDTNVWHEMNYICKAKLTKKTPPKSESFPTIKPKKYVEI